MYTGDTTQLHWSCKPAPRPIKSYLPKYGKKWFAKQAMYCAFCTKVGHTAAFCPLAPTVVSKPKEIPFVQKLMSTPRVKPQSFYGMSKEKALEVIFEEGERLNTGNPWASSDKIYDRLRRELGYWKAVGASNSVLSWLGYGIPAKFVKEPKHLAFPNHTVREPEAADHMAQDMAKHISTGCFVLAPKGSVKIANPILVIQQDKKWRRCDDCRYGNSFQAAAHFRMASLGRDIPLITNSGDEAITRDLEKAYYKIPMSEEAQAYMAFEWMGRYYFSKVMLFGMCQAPLYFTRVCRVIAAFFGALKIPNLHYIDDWYWPVKKGAIPDMSSYVLKLFTRLGWSFNAKGEEGVLVKLLGFVIDLVERKFVVPQEKRETTLALLHEHRLTAQSGKVEVKPLQRLMGRVISMTLAIPGVKVWCRELFSQISRATDQHTLWMVLSQKAREELIELTLLLSLSTGSPFVHPASDIEIWVDSGEAGWGAHTSTQVQVRDWFDEDWIGKSSTARELKGLVMSIKALSTHIQGKVVKLNMDSMCAVRNLIKGGGPVGELRGLIKEIWHLCKSLVIQLVPNWLKRSEQGMVVADELSKTATKWELTQMFKTSIEKKLGIEVIFPDVADAKAALMRALATGWLGALVLPVWTGQTWWQTVLDNTTLHMIEDIKVAMTPNLFGFPRWDFVVAEFTI